VQRCDLRRRGQRNHCRFLRANAFDADRADQAIDAVFRDAHLAQAPDETRTLGSAADQADAGNRGVAQRHIGDRKVDSAKKTLTLLNPDVNVVTYDVRLGADNVIFAGGGRNSLQLSNGSDRLQYVASGDADDRVSHFNPSQDRVELWGLTAGTLPSLSLQSDGQGGSVLSWQDNRITFSNTLLNLPSGSGLPAWITLGG